ncbi:hypothetical protein HO173_000513 [Letharia columbiana]|uniref:Uncharacterized protein n=1 Tax=Letharia columbiana TaxID=112416 RepID=A0A8H6G782_9LECA|nr:uncharacterized protein HO173_000513 [Letharia columbiana]KAF6241801.1 hypothetical protein HO173_000513 [Letharia columbiana]
MGRKDRQPSTSYDVPASAGPSSKVRQTRQPHYWAGEQAVTAEETSAAKVALPGFTHTIVTSNMFRQMHLVVLEIHTRLLRLHGTTVRMLPARMYTKTPGPVHLVIMEV